MLLLCLACSADKTAQEKDIDGDGAIPPLDCDDGDALRHPGAEERCDGVDQDCDGEVDEAPADGATWYEDIDGDGHAGELSTVVACEAPSGAQATAEDCDDLNGEVWPGAAERCDGLDQDCDGVVDNGAIDAATLYHDADGDGYGDPAVDMPGCPGLAGWVENADDCDDSDAEARPDLEWYGDADRDGWGGTLYVTWACAAPEGYTDSAGDCDDRDAAIYPGAPELCDEVDQDCDDEVDEDPAVAPLWYTDADSDGYGDSDSAFAACLAPEGSAPEGGDCDEADASVWPGAEELCEDEIDQDCNSVLDNTCLLELDWDGVDHDLEGDSTGDQFGGSLALGDLDGDGGLELIVGAAGQDDAATAAGAVYLFADAAGADATAADAALTVYGQSANDGAGQRVALLGDQDGDGLPELLISSPGSDLGGEGAGLVSVLTSPVLDGSASLGEALIVEGGAESDSLGTYLLEGDGDLDGDGRADLLVGAHGADGQSGAIYALNLSSGGDRTVDTAALRFSTGSAYGYSGYAGTARGDYNADGQADLAVSAPGLGGGMVWLYWGPVIGELSDAEADAELEGGAERDFLGSLIAAGDLSGDGVQDLLVSAKYSDTCAPDAGELYGWWGGSGGLEPSPSYQLCSEQSGDYLGYQTDAMQLADLDGNGVDDLLLGYSRDDLGATDAGGLYLVYGPTSGSWSLDRADRALWGESSADLLGRALAPGDADGDGALDLWVGVPQGGTTDRGLVALLGGGLL